MQDFDNGYLALCYHYIRPTEEAWLHHRLLGTDVDNFKQHMAMLLESYEVVTPESAEEFSCGGLNFTDKKTGMLVTFDDGLADHYRAAQILHDLNIKALFFIPSCILTEQEPANPIVIHYCFALFGIGKVLEVYRKALEEFRLPVQEYDIEYEKGTDNPWQTIALFKKRFKYHLKGSIARKVILFLYQEMLLDRYPEAMQSMHLDLNQVKGIIAMGHSIGAHSHTHVSIAAGKLGEKELESELIAPKRHLEKLCQVTINAMSYPFGEGQDCYLGKELAKRANEYKLAFTVENKLNTKQTSPFELGRYLPRSDENHLMLKKNLDRILC